VVSPVVPPETSTEVTLPPLVVDDNTVPLKVKPDPTSKNVTDPAESSQNKIRSAFGSERFAPVPPFAKGNCPVTPVDNGKPVAFVRVKAVGVPRLGVTRVGEVAKTSEPVPVSSVTAERRFAEEGVASQVATPDPRFARLATGKPVQLVRVPADGVPMFGVTRVGEVAKTSAPEPVSSVIAAARLEDDGVAKNVATFDPSPDTPVEIGSPVAFVSVAAEGVPRFGVVREGEIDKTTEPVPVEAVTPVPPLATGRVPVTPVESGSPVAFVSVTEEGVPRDDVEDKTTFPENVAGPDTDAFVISAVVATIFAEVIVSPDVPVIKFLSWAI
jgi:hypothetical protein